MSKIPATIALIIIASLCGCNDSSTTDLDKPVVSIEEKILTQRQLYDAIPNELAKEDSAVFAQNFINRWTKNQLMLRKAELNLTAEEKDIDMLMDEYRTSLLTHHYQQKLIAQKYAPMITSSEIEAYYTQMKDNFKISSPLIKGMFVKVSTSAPNISDLESWIRSGRPADLVELETYCFQNAKKFDSFLDEWRPLNEIIKQLPPSHSDVSGELINQKYYQTQDMEYKYFVSIRQMMQEGEQAPFEYVKDNIKSILLNKKRIEFIKQIEEDIYNEGLKQKVVKFY